MTEEPRTLGAILSACLLLGLTACSGEEPAAVASWPASSPRLNVLLLTVDTLRPDHLGCMGYHRKTSPHADGLARRGVLFRQAITAAARTVQSFPSILTGVYPPVHGLRYEGQTHDILIGRTTLTRVLRDNGYDAFAVTQGLNVGLHRDFEIYDPDIYLDDQGKKIYLPTRNDRMATQKAVHWLRQRAGNPGPFFLWMRYNAPHWPYEAPPPFGEMFDPEFLGPHTFNKGQRPDPRRDDIIFGKTRLPAREVEHSVAHYDGEVAFSDDAIGDLLAALEKMGQRDRTLVVLTSDHGESLGEHDYFYEHGAYLYDPVVRVPLIFVAPGRLPAGHVVDAQVRTIDIMPTILDLVGIEVPPGLQGVSLVPLIRGDEGPERPGSLAYSESGRNYFKENTRQYITGIAGKWRMIRSDRYKLIMIPKDPEPIWEFYDLLADPGETLNVLDRHPEEVAPLKKALLQILESDPGREDRDEPSIPTDLQEELRSLGYAGGRDPN
ncbi:MAG: sulfatase [Acidobacteria bacterium]|nr:sulfatase [Acidobacteriota bacterium]